MSKEDYKYEEFAELKPENDAMKKITVYIVKDGQLFESDFIGKYCRELETENWHYYETTKGMRHFKKENIIAVYDNGTKQDVKDAKGKL